MIPQNAMTATPQSDEFLSPLTDAYDPLRMRATGGVAIGDGSQGREVQNWTIEYDGTDIKVSPAVGPVAFTLTVPDVLSVCLAFDSNMAVAIAYMKADGAYLYFYNGVHSAYETLNIPGATHCRVCVDKTSAFYSGASDVMFAYTLANVLYWRQQRDRYTIQYTVGPTEKKLIRIGPSQSNRLQFELVTP